MGQVKEQIYGDVQICFDSECNRPTYKDRLCKHHFANRIKKAFRQHLKNIYRGPERAYAALDFTGRGYILQDDLLTSAVMQRVKFTREDVLHCFRMFNMFNHQGGP